MKFRSVLVMDEKVTDMRVLELQKSLPTPRNSGESPRPLSMQSTIYLRKRISRRLNCIAPNPVDFSIRGAL